MTAPDAALGKSVVLVVDDDPRNRLVMRVCLEKEFEVLEASDGKAGIDMVATGQSTSCCSTS